MSWSTRFQDDIKASVYTPLFRLERVQFNTEAGGEFAIYSNLGSPRIARVRVEGHEVSPQSLSSTWGKCSVELAGEDLGDLHELVARGTFVALYAGFGGYADTDYQVVALGQVRNVKGSAPRWVVEIIDVPSGLRQRPTTNAYDALLFDDVDSTTTLSAAYVVTDTTLTVVSTSGFARETGGTGAIRITSTALSVDPYYLVYSATTATTFTVSAANKMHTARTIADIGDLVEEVAYLYGHPIEIALKVLCSTGAGTNGTYDVLPSDWGLYVPVGFVDVDDAAAYQAGVAKVGAGSYLWEWPQVGAVDDGIGWLTTWLAAGGFFLTMRQGAITVRALQAATTPVGLGTVADIVDADVAQVLEHEWFSSLHDTEWANNRVYARNSSFVLTSTLSAGNTSVYQRPSGEIRDWDVSDRVFDNDAEIEAEQLNRVYEASERVPERIVLACAGLRLAGLCPGDIVTLTLDTHSRLAGPGGFDRRACWVYKVSADWTTPGVQVGLLVYPTVGDLWS